MRHVTTGLVTGGMLLALLGSAPAATAEPAPVVAASSASTARAAATTGGFHVLPQTRVGDTRSAAGTTKGKLGPGRTRDVQVTGRGGVPRTGVAAVELLVTAIKASRTTSLTVYPSDARRPAAPVLYVARGATETTTVTAPLSRKGTVRVHNKAGSAHVAVAVLGWYATASGAAPAGQSLTAVDHQVVARTTLRNKKVRTVAVAGRGGVPATGASAVELSLTATATSGPVTVTLHSAARKAPDLVTLQVPRRGTRTTTVVLPLGAGAAAKVKLVAKGGKAGAVLVTHGYFRAATAASALRLNPLTAATVADSRAGAGMRKGPLKKNGTAVVTVAGRAGVPAKGAQAVVVSLTASGASKATRVTAYRDGAARPGAPTLTTGPSEDVSTRAVVRLSPSGRIRLHNATGRTHVRVQVEGWYGAAPGKPGKPAPPPLAPKPGSVLAELVKAAGPLSAFAAPAATGRDAAVSVDASRTVRKVIGTAGGSLQVTTAAGDTVRLTVPAKALVADTELTATPLTAVAGITAGRVAGLRLLPDGLTLLAPANLAVTPVDGNTRKPARAFTTDGDGHALRPTWMYADTARLAMPVLHFSDHGMQVTNNATGSSFSGPEYAADVSGRLAKILEAQRQAALDGAPGNPSAWAEIEAVLDEYYRNTIVALLARSRTDCAYATAHISTALGWARQVELLGLTDGDADPRITAIWDAVGAALQNCWKEATSGKCLRMSPAQMKHLLSLARTMALYGIGLPDGRDPNPFDPSQIGLCGNVNGWVDILDEQHRSDAGYRYDSVTKARAWITAKAGLSWYEGQLVGLSVLSGEDAGSLLDASYYQRTEEHYKVSPTQECTSVDLRRDTRTGVAFATRPTMGLSFPIAAGDAVTVTGAGWINIEHRFGGGPLSELTDSCGLVGTPSPTGFLVSSWDRPVPTWRGDRSTVTLKFDRTFPSGTHMTVDGTLVVGGLDEVLAY